MSYVTVFIVKKIMTISYGGDSLIYYIFVLADPHAKSALAGSLFIVPTLYSSYYEK